MGPKGGTWRPRGITCIPVGGQLPRVAGIIGVKRNAERYMFCLPRPWMRSGPESGNPCSGSLTLSRELTFWALLLFFAFWAQNHLLGPFWASFCGKCIFGSKSAFWGSKAHVGAKGVKLIEIALVKQGFAGSGPKRALFAQILIFEHKIHFLAKNAFLEQKSTLGGKIALLWSRRLQRRNSARGM